MNAYKVFNDKVAAALNGPLDSRLVASRSQGGQQLDYLPNHRVIEALNLIFGNGEWDAETIEMRCIRDDQVPTTKWENKQKVAVKDGDGKSVMQARIGYAAHVRLTVRGEGGVVVKSQWGFGTGMMSDPLLASESAIKEAETDALKRCARFLGNPLGLALYDKERHNVVDGAEMERLAAEQAAAAQREAFIRSEATKMRAAVEAADSLPALAAAWTAGVGLLKDPAMPADLRADLTAAKNARKDALAAAAEPAFDVETNAAAAA